MVVESVAKEEEVASRHRHRRRRCEGRTQGARGEDQAIEAKRKGSMRMKWKQRGEKKTKMPIM